MPTDVTGPHRFLFVPASGPAGSGEYYRCLTLARAIRRLQPQVEIRFLLNRHARVERDDGFDYHLLDATPSRDVDAVAGHIDDFRPDVAVFDCSGRVRHFRSVRRNGGQVIWVSDRERQRRRGFRPRVLRTIDMHVIVDAGTADPRPSRIEALLNGCFGPVALEFAGAIVPEPQGSPPVLPSGRVPAAGDYAVFVPGGGGYRHRGTPVPEIFRQAAGRFHQATGLDAVVVMGPQYAGDAESAPGVEVVDALPTESLARLIASARLVVGGAGSMLSAQFLAAGVASVLVPAGGNDQPARIERYARMGLAEPSPLDAGAMADAAGRLYADPDRAREQIRRVSAAGFRNDAGRVAALLLKRVSD